MRYFRRRPGTRTTDTETLGEPHDCWYADPTTRRSRGYRADDRRARGRIARRDGVGGVGGNGPERRRLDRQAAGAHAGARRAVGDTTAGADRLVGAARSRGTRPLRDGGLDAWQPQLRPLSERVAVRRSVRGA